MKKIAPTTSDSLLRTGIILSVASSLVALFLAITAIQPDPYDDVQIETTRSLQTTDARLRFCYDRQIIPCDDGPLRAWNAAHPDDAFLYSR